MSYQDALELAIDELMNDAELLAWCDNYLNQLAIEEISGSLTNKH
jgi:hypothetical protein